MTIDHEGWWTSLRQRGRAALLVMPAAAVILLLSLLAAPAWAQQRVALVIGNGSYAHAPSLANPLNDAADIGASLQRLGFAVTRIENADQVTLRRGLQQFALAASASEMAAVFYAGHGIEVDRRNFLVPVDARLLSDADVEFETVPLDLLMRTVERTRGLRLIILDACRDNPFAVAMQRVWRDALDRPGTGTGRALGGDAGGLRGEGGDGRGGRRGSEQPVHLRPAGASGGARALR